ncbi:MAG: O-antigen ligase family protein [Nitrospira sp.]|nr:O-antigen ligase family protein [Nitrospira sp.]MBP6604912.1 O-antigen ligase family protein [Nitrospira sp.]HQY58627.1 O-antigen ligase family protein [Nitrospira sp.]HRA95503.1 O-antigen ligase family protein [Nitrospira sp.]
MTVTTSSPVDPTIQSAQEGEQQARARAFFWGFQRYVMIAIACSSFVPVLFRYQEHIVIILIALCLGMCALEKKSPWIRNPLDLPLWLFIIWVVCTVPFATDPAYSFAEWKKFVAQAGVFYWSLLVLDRCRRENLPQQILWALVMGGTVLAIYALVEFVHDGGTWKDRFIRAHGYGSDYNWLSTYMVMALPIAGSLLVVSYFAWARAMQVLALVLTGAAQVFSYTRGGWLGHVAQGMMLALLIGGRRWVLGVLGFLALVGAGLVVASHSGFQTDTVAAKTVDTRLTVWTIGLGEVSTHPMVGIGYGNNSFIKKFQEYSAERQVQLPEQERIIPAMHNTFLMVALGSGLPALLSFIWIFVALLRRLIPIPWLAGRNDKVTVLAAGIGLAVIGFAVRNLFDYMFMGSLAHLFWLLAAVGITVTGPGWRMARHESTSDDVASLGRIA